ncbi:hypothetical protein AB5J49_22995 [Streptomyces sp. R28]|uniref:Uncharacterized protein n=1 Tax=Streptomyces sp. R28 TaxID=3238628 RepID=A0AB39PZV8_9ACTN
MKENVYGYVATQYSNCKISDKQYMSVWAPYREGWRIYSWPARCDLSASS